MHAATLEEFRGLVATFVAAFPETVTLWFFEESVLLLGGSGHRHCQGGQDHDEEEEKCQGSGRGASGHGRHSVRVRYYVCASVDLHWMAMAGM